MQLIFFILVLYVYAQTPTAIPPPQPDSTWRRSRYIIDNRRNALFLKKPIYYPQQQDATYQKDLTAEGSISEPNFYGKYEDNSIPRKIIKYKDPNEYKYTKVYDTKNQTLNNYIQNDVGAKDGTGEVWVKTTTDATYPWEIAKEGNQIDGANEKHVYETRIETVSYHQEVIYNPPKKEGWYMEPKPKNYEQPEGGYEEPEQNYEKPEENYEQEEQNYEEEEQNYEEPERNYEESEQEKSYDMPDVRTPQEDNPNKFGYVVEGTNYRKYRVEERTPDGFIVGEYGVVSHDDGSLRGVRYTAEEGTNPKLIYETLIKFLSL